MALNGLLDIELSVPDPDELIAFWERRGMVRTADGVLGTADRPVQLRVDEAGYRHMSELHMSCETEQDLAMDGVEIAGQRKRRDRAAGAVDHRFEARSLGVVSGGWIKGHARTQPGA